MQKTCHLFSGFAPIHAQVRHRPFSSNSVNLKNEFFYLLPAVRLFGSTPEKPCCAKMHDKGFLS